MNKNAVIIGYSGHAFVVIENLITNGYTLDGYCDKKEKESNPFQLSYLGNEEDINTLNKLYNTNIFIGIGSNKIRADIFHKLEQNALVCPSLVHRSAIISSSAQLGRATVIMPGAVINSYAKLGNAVICNTSAVIEHECILGNYTHIAPGAVLAGNVHIGPYSFIGANAVIKQGLKIGANVIVGAGAVVLKDIPDNATVYGNPAKISVYE